MEMLSLNQLSSSDKIILLNELGYQTDGKFVLDEKGEVVKDKYVDIPVELGKMLILPGSEIILDDNELSVTMYMEEYGEL